MKQTIHLIAAARPNFMKIAPLYHALARETWCRVAIVHTGQHYDANMSDTFLQDLCLPDPAFHLDVGSGSHGRQTGAVMIAYESVVERDRPDWLVVVGDVNSTIAAALVGVKLGIPTVHLEAGLRSRDRSMPEEINRLATDAIADVLWTPSRDADANLLAEGVAPERIECIGNIMIDSYEMLRATIEQAGTRRELQLDGQPYGVVTLHRPSNVDTRDALEPLVQVLADAAQRLPLVFAVHPRTRKRLTNFALQDRLIDAGVRLVDPLSYLQFMKLVTGGRVVITDSGGVQEETTYLDIACLTLRDNTERPITVTEGSNRLVQPATLGAAIDVALQSSGRRGSRPDLWDGHAAERAVASLRRRASIAT